MKLVNWNVRWAGPRSKHSVEILNRIDRHSPEIVCLTKTQGHPLRMKLTVAEGFLALQAHLSLDSTPPFRLTSHWTRLRLVWAD